MEPPRNAALRRFRWAVRLSLLAKLVALAAFLAILLAVLGGR